MCKNLMLVVVHALSTGCSGPAQADPIQHDAEYYVLEDQHHEEWALEDAELDKKLAELKDVCRQNISDKNGSSLRDGFYSLVC